MKKKLIFLFAFFNHFYFFADRPSPTPEVKNIFYNLPTLETERLILRKVNLEDVYDLYDIYSDYEVIKYVACELDTCLEDTKKWIVWRLEKYKVGKPTPWAIILKNTNKLIGLAGFCDWNPEHASANLMILEARKYWGFGYIKEVLQKILSYGFIEMGLNRVESWIHPENERSLKLHGKLGFKNVGIIPEKLYYRDSYCDRVVFTLLKQDFLKSINF